MKERELKVGDVVQLNSGGCPMTITSMACAEIDSIEVTWMREGAVYRETVPLACVKLYVNVESQHSDEDAILRNMKRLGDKIMYCCKPVTAYEQLPSVPEEYPKAYALDLSKLTAGTFAFLYEDGEWEKESIAFTSVQTTELAPRQISLKILDERIKEWGLPSYGTTGSAGVDLFACVTEPLLIGEGETILIPTGIAVHINDPKLVALLLPRSGLGHKHGIVLGNLVGVIDSDYQGQVFVSCWNRNTVTYKHTPTGELGWTPSGYGADTTTERIDKSFTINPGDKICQMLFVPVEQVTFEVMDDFAATKRGSGGFGHTGIVANSNAHAEEQADSSTQNLKGYGKKVTNVSKLSQQLNETSEYTKEMLLLDVLDALTRAALNRQMALNFEHIEWSKLTADVYVDVTNSALNSIGFARRLCEPADTEDIESAKYSHCFSLIDKETDFDRHCAQSILAFQDNVLRVEDGMWMDQANKIANSIHCDSLTPNVLITAIESMIESGVEPRALLVSNFGFKQLMGAEFSNCIDPEHKYASLCHGNIGTMMLPLLEDSINCRLKLLKILTDNFREDDEKMLAERDIIIVGNGSTLDIEFRCDNAQNEITESLLVTLQPGSITKIIVS